MVTMCAWYVSWEHGYAFVRWSARAGIHLGLVVLWCSLSLVVRAPQDRPSPVRRRFVASFPAYSDRRVLSPGFAYEKHAGMCLSSCLLGLWPQEQLMAICSETTQIQGAASSFAVSAGRLTAI